MQEIRTQPEGIEKGIAPGHEQAEGFARFEVTLYHWLTIVFGEVNFYVLAEVAGHQEDEGEKGKDIFHNIDFNT